MIDVSGVRTSCETSATNSSLRRSTSRRRSFVSFSWSKQALALGVGEIALGHVAGVQDYAPDVAVVAEIGDVRLERAPAALLIRQPEGNQGRLAQAKRRAETGAVLGMDELDDPVSEDGGLGTADHPHDRVARVPALGVREREHEVGSRSYEALEMGAPPPGARDERPAEQAEDGETHRREQALQRDQVRTLRSLF